MDLCQRERVARLLGDHPVVAAFRRAAGAVPAHLVGGALRDRLLGLDFYDLDFVVARDGELIGRRVADELGARLVALGREAFASLRLVGDGWEADLWDRQGVTLDADLERRDFTVDSLAMSLANGDIVDPCGALDDLSRGILRATTDRSFVEDPLRVVRLPRLLLQLPGFSVDPATLVLARESAPHIASVATERVREELLRILGSREASRGIVVLHALDLYPGLWLGRPGIPDLLGGAAVDLERMEALRGPLAAALSGTSAPEPDPAAARWAVLFRALAGGRSAEQAAVTRFASAGYLTRDRARVIRALLAHEPPSGDERRQRSFLHRAGTLWPTSLLVQGIRASEQGEWLDMAGRLAALARREGSTIFDPPGLVDGHDLQQDLGLSPGPELGRLLAAVSRAQVEGTVRTREEALELARRLVP